MTRIVALGLILAVTAGCQSTRWRQRNAAPRSVPYAAAPVPAGPSFGPGAPAPGFPAPPPGAVLGPPPGSVAPFPTVPPSSGPPNGSNPAFPTAPSLSGPPNGSNPPFPTAPPPSGPPNGSNPPFPTVPPPSGPPNGSNPPFPTVPPSGPPNGSNPPMPNGLSVPNAGGRVESNWLPADNRTANPLEGRVLLGPPEAIPDGAIRPPAKQLYPPQITATPEPPTNPPAQAAPVGIPNFAQVAPRISTGRRSAFDDGFDWLQQKGYRGVVYLRLPGEDGEMDRDRAEKRGLKYRSLEVSPHLLTKETVDEFLQLVRDPRQQPIFVYDRDGVLAGGMWYLWLRLVEDAPEDAAKIRARSLGLRPEREGAHRDMWQSVQRYLNEFNGR